MNNNILNKPRYNSFRYRWNLFLCALFGHKPGIDGGAWEMKQALKLKEHFSVGYCPRCWAYESPEAVLIRCHMMEKYGSGPVDDKNARGTKG